MNKSTGQFSDIPLNSIPNPIPNQAVTFLDQAVADDDETLLKELLKTAQDISILYGLTFPERI